MCPLVMLLVYKLRDYYSHARIINHSYAIVIGVMFTNLAIDGGPTL